MHRRFLTFTLLALCGWAACADEPPIGESPRAVVEKRFALVGRYDDEGIAALYASAAIETSPAFCTERRGPAGALRTYSELFKSYPTITAHITSLMVEGERVAVQFVARVGNPDGSVAFESRLANFLIVRDGKITRDDTYFDPKGRPCS
jgi:ketosteroid isomerase-like protein